MLTVRANVFEVQSDALLLTIDGAKAGMEGNIARQFAKRWPEDWADMVRTLRYPIPIGRTVAVPWEGDAPWKLFLFASTLHHLDVLDDGQKAGVVSQAFIEALKLCLKQPRVVAIDSRLARRLAPVSGAGPNGHVESGRQKHGRELWDEGERVLRVLNPIPRETFFPVQNWSLQVTYSDMVRTLSEHALDRLGRLARAIRSAASTSLKRGATSA